MADDIAGLSGSQTGDAATAAEKPRRRRMRWAVRIVAAIAVAVVLLAGGVWGTLVSNYSGEPNPAARGTGNDALWLGHAWVDGRKKQSDVEALAAQLKQTGIRDLFVHAGPFLNDGSLDRGMRPRAAWLIGALHQALPGVRVQAWLGAHPLPQELHLTSPQTRARILVAVEEILDDGFDGVHYDFEPVDDGNDELITVLRETREVTRRRGVLLSVSAIHLQPWPGTAVCVSVAPGRWALWSGDYLAEVAAQVDQVALMSYDTGLVTPAMYGGYVKLTTEIALAVVPPEVTLFIGVPAYHDERLVHHADAETMPAALRGVRLGMGAQPLQRKFGVALYVDFAATAEDWDTYHRDWA